jgi:hypothetical protein
MWSMWFSRIRGSVMSVLGARPTRSTPLSTAETTAASPSSAQAADQILKKVNRPNHGSHKFSRVTA